MNLRRSRHGHKYSKYKKRERKLCSETSEKRKNNAFKPLFHILILLTSGNLK